LLRLLVWLIHFLSLFLSLPSLEKVREAIEEFRQQLGQLKDKQQY
jgi:hypothetical protein